MLDFLQVILSGIGVGSTYALMGLSLVIIYKTSDIMNFTQGEMALITAYFTYTLLKFYHFPYLLAFILATVFTVLVGFFIEFTIIRRAKEASHLGMIIITMGVEMIILGFVSWKFGAESDALPFPIGPYDALNWGGLFISMMEVLTFVVAIVLITALFLFFRYSKL
ncbi:branched-chain amino acid ABC transporter permease, partial [bacterium]|nr:branched-chain amino acid ABC transporter permease [bacterium]